MDDQEIEKGTRIGSMFLDHFIMSLIGSIFFIPEKISNFFHSFNSINEQEMLVTFGGISYIGIIGFAVYFCKDSINGRSIAKRIFKLQLVENETGRIASPLKCFIRNIFCIIWPIEFFVSLSNPGRRIGDRVAGTKLIKFDPSIEQAKINTPQIVLSLLLSYGLSFLITFFFNSNLPKF